MIKVTVTMKRRAVTPAMVLVISTAVGCGNAQMPPSLATDFASFKAAPNQWAIDVRGMSQEQSERILAAIEDVPGVTKGSAVVNPQGNYVAFTTNVSARTNAKEHTTIKIAVEDALIGLGLETGDSKTRIPM